MQKISNQMSFLDPVPMTDKHKNAFLKNLYTEAENLYGVMMCPMITCQHFPGSLLEKAGENHFTLLRFLMQK